MKINSFQLGGIPQILIDPAEAATWFYVSVRGMDLPKDTINRLVNDYIVTLYQSIVSSEDRPSSADAWATVIMSEMESRVETVLEKIQNMQTDMEDAARKELGYDN
jgi:hypothetical protein